MRAYRCPPRIMRLVELAAAVFDLDVQDILQDRRLPEICKARFAVYFAGYHGLLLSKSRLARAIGDRDHSTIIHGLRRADHLRATDPDFRSLTDRLLAAIKEA